MKQIKQKYITLLKKGVVEPYGYSLKNRNGEIYHVQVYPSLLKLDEKNVGIQTVVIDITDSKKTQMNTLIEAELHATSELINRSDNIQNSS